MGAVNALVKPIINVLSIPISFLTLGLSGFVVNAALLLGIAYLAQTFAQAGPHHRWLADVRDDGGHHPRGRRGIDGARADHDGRRARRPRLTAVPDASVPAEALVRAARRFGTPVHVTSAEALADAARELEAAFPDPWLRAFSLKANDVPAVVARLAAAGLDANVVSSGEWAAARAAGLPNDRITLEGVGKSTADLRAAVRACAAGQPAALGGRRERRGA